MTRPSRISANDPTAGGERTAWARNLAAPVRRFLGLQAASAGFLLAATVAAVLWANSPWSDAYESLWSTTLSIELGDHGIALDLRHWINQGLMTFFFLVVGLEAKRELDVGELRERGRITVPVAAAIGGATVPVLIFLAVNAGGDGAGAWGAAMSTDTAFALGALALLAPRATRLRVFLLTLAVVDDLIALLVIAIVYTDDVSIGPADRRGPAVRRPDRPALRARRVAPPAGRAGRRGAVGGAAGVGHRPRDRRARRRADHRRLSTPAAAARAGRRAHALVPRAADAGLRAGRPARRGRGHLAQRAAPVSPAAVGQLPDRAAVRARQRRRRAGQRAARRGRRLADHAGHPVRATRSASRPASSPPPGSPPSCASARGA